MHKDSLKELADITGKFNAISEGVTLQDAYVAIKRNGDEPCVKTFEVGNHLATWTGLYNNGNCAISIVENNKAGDRFPAHHHRGVELLFAISGSFGVVYLNGNGEEAGEIRVEKGEAHTIKAGREHFVRYHSDTFLLAVTAPADPEYPEGAN